MRDVDLLVVGDCNPDLVLAGPRVRPQFGQGESWVEQAELVVGGTSSITACGAARLGLRTALAAVVGDDVLGRFMLAELAGRDVDTTACVVDTSAPTGISAVLVEPDDRATLTFRGTIGAGDSTNAGWLAGVRSGWPVERAAALAAACGSLSTRGRGGTATQPTMAEALARL